MYKSYDFVNVFTKNNLEKFSNKYSYGQLSVKYLVFATKVVEMNENNTSTVVRILKQRNEYLEESGLDINSCLQFLIDYYTQLMKAQVRDLICF